MFRPSVFYVQNVLDLIQLFLYMFNYYRLMKDRVKGSRASLASTCKLDSTDDDMSLAGYADMDAGNFQEDGSFIGKY